MHQIILNPDYQFLEQIEALGPFQTGACFQCRKCTNGCPVTFAMDLYPDEVIRMVILGQRDTVLSCRTIWVCAACETCTTRCPNEVKIVVSRELTLEILQKLRRQFPAQTPILLQPQSQTRWSTEKGLKLLTRAMKAGVKNIRFCVQIHKYIGMR